MSSSDFSSSSEMPVAVPRRSYEGGMVLSEQLPVAVIDHFITPDECADLIDRAATQMQRATVSLDDASAVVPGRSGENCWLWYQDDAQVREIGERVARLVGIPLENAEAFQVLRYGPGSEYRAHYDAYDLGTARGRRCCRRGGQRVVTALLYLNSVEEGGETAFPRLGVKVAPALGRLVVFNNVDENQGRPHPSSLHAGMPVLQGEKWAGNFWFHQYPMSRVVFPAPDTETGSRPGITSRPADQSGAVAQTSPLSAKPVVSCKINRASSVLNKAFSKACESVSDVGGGTLFTYWDTYGGKTLDLSDSSGYDRVLQLVERRVTNPLANKRSLARLLAESGLSHWAPPTCESVADALRLPGWEERIWFVKSAFGTGGKGMFCVRGDELKELALQSGQIIQAGVENIRLIDGRKFTVRIYVLVWNGSVYLYDDGFAVIHGVPYAPGSTDYAVQIDHRGYQLDDSAVTMLPLHRYEPWTGFSPAIRDCIAALQPVLQPTISASSDEIYAVLGLDFLLLENMGASLLEMNSMPNFIHNKEVNETVNTPFWQEVMAVLLGGSDAGTRRLQRVWPPGLNT